MKRYFLLSSSACLALLTACPDDTIAPLEGADMSSPVQKDMGSSGPVDMTSPSDQGGAGGDMSALPDQSGTTDQGTPEEDMGSSQDMQDMSSVEDTPADMPDMSASDMSAPDMMTADMAVADMGASSYADRAKGDCVRTSDCGSPDLFCEREAVGGTCYGSCIACDNLPGPNTYQCIAGACVPECSEDADCPPGRSCNTRRGVCQVERCTNNVCPVPWFGCSEPDGICVRVACDAGQMCPTGTQCDGSYCIEDHSTMP